MKRYRERGRRKTSGGSGRKSWRESERMKRYRERGRRRRRRKTSGGRGRKSSRARERERKLQSISLFYLERAMTRDCFVSAGVEQITSCAGEEACPHVCPLYIYI